MEMMEDCEEFQFERSSEAERPFDPSHQFPLQNSMEFCLQELFNFDTKKRQRCQRDDENQSNDIDSVVIRRKIARLTPRVFDVQELLQRWNLQSPAMDTSSIKKTPTNWHAVYLRVKEILQHVNTR
jgi:hypothetical protein